VRAPNHSLRGRRIHPFEAALGRGVRSGRSGGRLSGHRRSEPDPGNLPRAQPESRRLATTRGSRRVEPGGSAWTRQHSADRLGRSPAASLRQRVGGGRRRTAADGVGSAAAVMHWVSRCAGVAGYCRAHPRRTGRCGGAGCRAADASHLGVIDRLRDRGPGACPRDHPQPRELLRQRAERGVHGGCAARPAGLSGPSPGWNRPRGISLVGSGTCPDQTALLR